MTLEEIKKLPEGTLLKIKDTCLSKHPVVGAFLPLTHTISDHGSDYSVCCLSSHGDGYCWFRPEDLVLAEEPAAEEKVLTWDDIKVGEVYMVKDKDRCITFSSHPDFKFIKITKIKDQILNYDILDKDFKKISCCSICLEPEDLIPVTQPAKPTLDFATMKPGTKLRVIDAKPLKDVFVNGARVGKIAEFVEIDQNDNVRFNLSGDEVTSHPWSLDRLDSLYAFELAEPEETPKLNGAGGNGAAFSEMSKLSDDAVFEAFKSSIKQQKMYDDLLEPVNKSFHMKSWPCADYPTRYNPNPNPKKKGGLKKTMNAIFKKLVSADVRALIKAGYLDTDLELTDEGVDFVCQHYLMANLKELAAEAKKELKAKKNKDEEED